jgi:hypothetical protein
MSLYRSREEQYMNAIRNLATAVALASAAISLAHAQAPARPVVVELFTSEGCSSCPPADALLTELAGTRHDLLPLAFHVTYWNSLGWTDPFSLGVATARQEGYAHLSGVGGVYTPQMVIDGTTDVVGSEREDVLHALHEATARAVDAVPVRLARAGDDVTIDVAAGTGAATVWLVGYDASHRTPVGRGENAGRTLLESNIVRSLTAVADWRGTALDLHRAAPVGERLAVLVQAKDGRILGAASQDER